MNPTTPPCANCGHPIPPDLAGAYCPRCLLQLGHDLLPKLPPPEATTVEPQVESLVTEGRPASHLPRQVGDYQLLEEVARGGMGIVFRARQMSLNRIVAMKMILAGPDASKEFIHRFRTEAAAAANLQHPNIVAVHEVGAYQGENYLVMDFVNGPDLARLVGQQPLPADRAAHYLHQLAEAVAHAHERGILHRDLKPSNIIVDSATDQPRITDFGLAKRFDPTHAAGGASCADFTLTGQVLGSPNYMSPEQAAGARAKVSRPTDVYGLGAILYHALTARPPFQAESLTATLHQVVQAEPLAPHLLNPSVPRDLETICLKCLEKEPARRYHTAHELAAELGRFLRDEPILARPTTAAGKAWRWCRRKPALAASLLAIALLLSIVLIGSPIAALRISRELYLSDMHLAAVALEDGHLGRARQLLEAHRPSLRLLDQRDFTWRLLWRQSRGDEIATLPERSRAVATVLLAPEPDRLVSLLKNGELEAWNLAAPRVQLSIPRVSRAGGFTPDGRRLALGMQDGSVAVYDTKTGRVLHKLQTGGEIVAVLADGEKVVTTHPDAAFRLWDLTTGQEQLSFPGRGGIDDRGRDFGLRVCLTPDGGRLASLDAEGAGISIWSVHDQTRVASIPEPGDTARPLCFSADGTLLATGSFNGLVRLWDALTGAPRTPALVHDHQDPITTAAFSPNGALLATASVGQTIKLWSATTGQELDTLTGHENAVWSLAFSADSRRLASGSEDQTIRLWDVSSRRKVRSISHLIEPLAWSPDSRTLAARSSSDTVTLVDVATMQISAVLPASACVIAFNPDANEVLTVSTNGSLQWWDLASRKVRAKLPGTLPVTGTRIVFSPDRKIAALCGSSTLRLWDLDSGRTILLAEPAPAIESAAFSASKATFVTGSHEGVVDLWDTHQQRRIGSIAAHASAISSLVVSPDGQTLVSGSAGGEIKLWDPRSRQLRAQLNGHKRIVRGLALSPDGDTLASASADHTVRLWNTTLRREVASLKLFPELAAGWRGEVDFVEFAPDGNHLAVRTRGGAFRILAAAAFHETDGPRRFQAR